MKARESSGSMIAVGCVLLSAAFALFLLVLDVGRFHAARERARTLAQASALASLRMRSEALQRIAERWQPIGQKLGNVDSAARVFVSASDAASVSSLSADLSRALSGYQARTTSIVTVIAQSNDLPRDRLVVDADTGTRLDVHAQPALTVDEAGAVHTIAGLWYQRGWSPADDAPDPAGFVSHRVAFSLQPFLKTAAAWSAASAAQARLRWNSSTDGNGGYPRDWAHALAGTRVDPNRTASYRAVLTEPAP